MSSIPFGDMKGVSGMTDRPSERKGFSLQRLLKIIILILLVIFLAEVLYHFVLSKALVLKNVYVKADPAVGLSVQEIRELAGLTGAENYFLFKADKVCENLGKWPTVKSVSVTKVFPDKINIVLTARTPLAASIVTHSSVSIPVIFDSEGVVFRVGDYEGLKNLPIISGLTYPEPKIGMRLPDQVLDYLGQLETVARERPELLKLISEIYFIKKGNVFSEVLLYPVQVKIRVITMPEINVRILKNVIVVLDTIEKFGMTDRVEEVDLRTDEPVYREREG